ncbi:hypothetical protein ACHAW5_004452 [Stephanodiscus triporus]|uniref:AB hydrolase-1 domain-containing protein n=1 Tax=Stephanodiscus triporus TaxID=2934178 RepID=A0ABD3QQH1_9STRA
MWPFSHLSSSSSSPSIADRLEALRVAEGRLLEYARTRFGHHRNRNQNHDENESENESESDRRRTRGTSRFELFDTPIPPPSSIRRRGSDNDDDDDEDDEDRALSLHGVMVTNDDRPGSSSSSSSSSPSTSSHSSHSSPPLVLLHGYANGSLYFYRNLSGLSRHFDRVYALDMLGWGLSSRPRFDLVTRSSPSPTPPPRGEDDVEDDYDAKVGTRVAAAEAFFVESLERWRAHHDIPRLTLAGHSMGGYLATAYAERHPDRVHRLILLSPVGVPRRRPVEEEERSIDSLPFYARYAMKALRYLFENRGITPGDFLRSLPHGKSRAMVDSYVERRLPSIACPDERDALGEYLYQNSMLPGSGEYCLGEILTGGAYAKSPLVDRIHDIVVVPPPHASLSENDYEDDDDGLEVHMIYGQRDWMDYRGGLEEEGMGGGGGGGSSSSCGPPPRVHVHGVRDAGHLLMLDNHEEFNSAVVIAAGLGDDLPSGSPRPVTFVPSEEEEGEEGEEVGGVVVPSHRGSVGGRSGADGRSSAGASGRGGTRGGGGGGGGGDVLFGEEGAASTIVTSGKGGDKDAGREDKNMDDRPS